MSSFKSKHAHKKKWQWVRMMEWKNISHWALNNTKARVKKKNERNKIQQRNTCWLSIYSGVFVLSPSLSSRRRLFFRGSICFYIFLVSVYAASKKYGFTPDKNIRKSHIRKLLFKHTKTTPPRAKPQTQCFAIEIKIIIYVWGKMLIFIKRRKGDDDGGIW